MRPSFETIATTITQLHKGRHFTCATCQKPIDLIDAERCGGDYVSVMAICHRKTERRVIQTDTLADPSVMLAPIFAPWFLSTVARHGAVSSEARRERRLRRHSR